jgi:hypothetical protein
MGEVKDKVKGDGLKKKLLRKKKIVEGKNLIEYFEALQEEVSECIQIKDDDSLSEGDLAKPDNVRKAALLRSVHSLLTSGLTLLEDY